MAETICTAAAAAAANTAELSPSSAQSAEASAGHAIKKHTARAFLVLCDDFRTAKIELETEVFSGFDMIVLLLDEIDSFMRDRRGTIQNVLKLLAARGIVLTERTLKDYMTRARKVRRESGDAVAKLRAGIFEAAKARQDMAGSAGSPDAAKEGVQPVSPASSEPAGIESGISKPGSTAPCRLEEADEWGMPDDGWLNDAVSQAMEQDEPKEKVQAKPQEPAGASSAKKDKQAKKRARRRARLSR